MTDQPFFCRLQFVAVTVLAIAACASAQTPSGSTKISPLSTEMRAAMTGKSWKPECPVPPRRSGGRPGGLSGLRRPNPRRNSCRPQAVCHRGCADISGALRDSLSDQQDSSPWENYGPDVYAEQDITVGFYCERADDAPRMERPRLWRRHRSQSAGKPISRCEERLVAQDFSRAGPARWRPGQDFAED